jgi:hypothetical protein
VRERRRDPQADADSAQQRIDLLVAEWIQCLPFFGVAPRTIHRKQGTNVTQVTTSEPMTPASIGSSVPGHRVFAREQGSGLGALAITAAVVGVILNLALWFSLHTLFATVDEVHWRLVHTQLAGSGTCRSGSLAVDAA